MGFNSFFVLQQYFLSFNRGKKAGKWCKTPKSHERLANQKAMYLEELKANSLYWQALQWLTLMVTSGCSLTELCSSSLLQTPVEQLQPCRQATSHALEKHAAYFGQCKVRKLILSCSIVVQDWKSPPGRIRSRDFFGSKIFSHLPSSLKAPRNTVKVHSKSSQVPALG